MEVELVFTGMATFVNLYNEDEKIIGPSMILLKADDIPHEEHAAGMAGMPMPGMGGENALPPVAPPGNNNPPAGNNPDPNKHIPFIAFDSRLVSVDNMAGFEPVTGAPFYLYRSLDGVEITIQGHNDSVPIVDSSFGYVVSRDMYWPESKGRWNHDVVPLAGNQPKKTVAKALFRFGQGRISAGRLCPFRWRFTKLNGDTFSRHFAEEVSYSYSNSEESLIVVKLLDLENTKLEIEKLHFQLLPGKVVADPTNGAGVVDRTDSKLTLFIGNNTEPDMQTAVRRARTDGISGPTHHFAVFNSVVNVGGEAPPQLPQAEQAANLIVSGGGGGSDGGICGPTGG
jgi:hypothetical protein